VLARITDEIHRRCCRFQVRFGPPPAASHC
jgi:hypothetical protein